MINDGNIGDGGQNQQQQLTQISAKEFASKFKSKRGESHCRPSGEVSAVNAQRSLTEEPLLGDGNAEWQITPGHNLFRREDSD